MNAPLYHPSKKQVETYVNSFFDWKTTISSFNYNLGDHADVNEYYLDLIKILDAAALAVSLERDRDFETLFSFIALAMCVRADHGKCAIQRTLELVSPNDARTGQKCSQACDFFTRPR